MKIVILQEMKSYSTYFLSLNVREYIKSKGEMSYGNNI